MKKILKTPKVIKVLVVEDEPIIGKNIVKLINEYSQEVEVVHLAINGKRALEYLKNNSVDVVFSDIKMPIMDGIELIKNINELYPNILTFFISGFQEFEYARLALEYNVEKYLLKPISKENIKNSIDYIIKTMDKNKVKEKKNTIEEAIGIEQSLTNNQSLCTIIYICVGSFHTMEDEALVNENIVKESNKIENIIIDIINEDKNNIFIKGKTSSEKLLILDMSNKKDPHIIGSKIYKKLVDSLVLPVTIGVSEEAFPMFSMKENIKKLRKQISKNIILFSSNYIPTYVEKSEEKFEKEELTKAIILALTEKSNNKINEAITDIINKFLENKDREIKVILYLKKIAFKFFDNLTTMPDLILEIDNAFSYSIDKETLIQELTLTFHNYSKIEYEEEQNSGDLVCEKVATYINNNYKKSISAIELGEKFNISPIQLARRFKGQYGLSISEYSNNVKINCAKNIIDKVPNILIKEVAIEVGYNDQYYFSKIFKKLTGQWPSEYSKNS